MKIHKEDCKHHVPQVVAVIMNTQPFRAVFLLKLMISLRNVPNVIAQLILEPIVFMIIVFILVVVLVQNQTRNHRRYPLIQPQVWSLTT